MWNGQFVKLYEKENEKILKRYAKRIHKNHPRTTYRIKILVELRRGYNFLKGNATEF